MITNYYLKKNYFKNNFNNSSKWTFEEACLLFMYLSSHQVRTKRTIESKFYNNPFFLLQRKCPRAIRFVRNLPTNQLSILKLRADNQAPLRRTLEHRSTFFIISYFIFTFYFLLLFLLRRRCIDDEVSPGQENWRKAVIICLLT